MAGSPRIARIGKVVLCMALAMPLLGTSSTAAAPGGGGGGGGADDTCTVANLQVQIAPSGADIATACLKTIETAFDGTITADVAITNNKTIPYNVVPSGSANVFLTGQNGYDLFAVLKDDAQKLGTTDGFLPILGKTTMHFNATFPPGGSLSITLKKHGDGLKQSALLVAMQLGSIAANFGASIDVSAVINQDPTVAMHLAEAVAKAANDRGLDLAVIGAKFESGNPEDITSGFTDLVDLMGKEADTFGPILHVPAAALQNFAHAFVGIITGILDLGPTVTDYVLAQRSSQVNIRSTAPTSVVKGAWLQPNDGQSINGVSVHLAAQISPQNHVQQVNFTAWWSALGQNVPWKVVCPLLAGHNDVFECDWNFDGVPTGDVLISFDTLDTEGNPLPSLGGIRTLHFVAAGIQRSTVPVSIKLELTGKEQNTRGLPVWTITWIPDGNLVKGFHIYAGNDQKSGVGQFQTIATVGADTTSYSTPVADVTCFKLSAFSDSGESDFSQAVCTGDVSAVPVPNTPTLTKSNIPAPPTNVQVTTGKTVGGLPLTTVTWSVNSGNQDGFRIYTLKSSTFSRSSSYVGDVDYHNIKGSSANIIGIGWSPNRSGEYRCFWVVSYNGAGESDPSGGSCVTIP